MLCMFTQILYYVFQINNPVFFLKNLKRANEEKAILKDLKSRDQFYLMLMSAVKRLYIPNVII